MSGHRKFTELTKKYTSEDRREIENIKAEMCATREAESDRKEKFRAIS